jgi:hypothetical protein
MWGQNLTKVNIIMKVRMALNLTVSRVCVHLILVTLDRKMRLLQG